MKHVSLIFLMTIGHQLNGALGENTRREMMVNWLDFFLVHNSHQTGSC